MVAQAEAMLEQVRNAVLFACFAVEAIREGLVQPRPARAALPSGARHPPIEWSHHDAIALRVPLQNNQIYYLILAQLST